MASARLITSALAVIALLCAAPVSARTFRCDEVWSNASIKNSQNINDCLANGTHLKALLFDEQHLPHVVFAIIPVVFLVFGLLVCPTVTVCRYVCKCCGSYRRRPDTVCCGGAEWDLASPDEKDIAYQSSSVRNTKACSIIVLLLGFGLLLLAVTATTTMNKTYSRVFSEAKGVITWVDDQSLNIRTVMTINETKQLIPPLTQGFFDNISNRIVDIRKTIDDGKKSADPFVENVNIAALCVGIIPLIFLILTVICAVCDIRTGVLCINSVCHLLFLIIYGVLAFVFLVGALLMGDVAGERNLFLDNHNKGGLISLVLVPMCNDFAPFEVVKDDINRTIIEQATSACTSMREICDGSATYDAANPNHVFYCPTLTDPTQCATFDTANNFALSLTIKPGGDSANQCRHNLTDPTTVFTPCNISSCGDSCTLEFVRTTSASIVKNLGYAANAEYAYRAYVEPLLSCNVMYEQALRPLVVCPEVVKAMQMIGGAFFGFTVLFVIGMFVIWRGQKRFYKYPQMEQVESDLDIDEAEEEFHDLGATSTEVLVAHKNSKTSKKKQKKSNEPIA
jgi:hypothetical protein